MSLRALDTSGAHAAGAELVVPHELDRARKDTAAALLELSRSVFNRPDQHDRYRSGAAYQRWSACAERLRSLESQAADPR